MNKFMKTLSCADMGIANCNFVAHADSETEVIDKLMEHGKHAHSDKMSGGDMNEMVTMMKSKIKDAM